MLGVPMFWIGALVGAIAVLLGRMIYGLCETSELANMLLLAARRLNLRSTPDLASIPETPQKAAQPERKSNRAVGA